MHEKVENQNHSKMKKFGNDEYMWQSRVEIEHYSVAYFDRIAAFEAL